MISYYHFQFVHNYSSCTRHASSTRIRDVMIVRYPVLSVTVPNKVCLIVVFLRADLSLWLCCFLSVSLRMKMIVVSVFSTIVLVSSKSIRSRRYWIQLHKFQFTECHHHHFQRRQFWLNFANHIRSSSDFWFFHSVRATLSSTGSSTKHFSYPLQIFVPDTQSNQSKYLTLSHTWLFMNFMLMSVSFSFHSCQLRFSWYRLGVSRDVSWNLFHFLFFLFLFGWTLKDHDTSTDGKIRRS